MQKSGDALGPTATGFVPPAEWNNDPLFILNVAQFEESNDDFCPEGSHVSNPSKKSKFLEKFDLSSEQFPLDKQSQIIF